MVVGVLWISALILWLAFAVSTNLRLRNEEDLHALRRSQAFFYAVSGVQEALLRMGRPPPLDMEDESAWFPDGSLRIVTFRGGGAQVLVELETEKVNVNRADRNTLRTLLQDSGLDAADADILADRIEDFLDPDDTVRLDGAEWEEYEAMGLGHGPLNGPLVSLDQLLLVPGLTRELFFGRMLSTEPPSEDADGPQLPDIFPGIGSLFHALTVYGNRGRPVEDVETPAAFWISGGTYRILSYGRSSSGPPGVLLWMIVRHVPESPRGCEVLYSKML